MADNIMETIKAKVIGNRPTPSDRFDKDSFAKPDERVFLERKRLEFLRNGGKIKRVNGVGAHAKITLCQYFRPRVGATETWSIGCVPRPDTIAKT